VRSVYRDIELRPRLGLLSIFGNQAVMLAYQFPTYYIFLGLDVTNNAKFNGLLTKTYPILVAGMIVAIYLTYVTVKLMGFSGPSSRNLAAHSPPISPKSPRSSFRKRFTVRRGKLRRSTSQGVSADEIACAPCALMRITVLSSCDVPVLAIMRSEDLHARSIGRHDWEQQKGFMFWTGMQRRLAAKNICRPIIPIIVQPWPGAA